MKLTEQEMFGRIEIALKVYYQEMGISDEIQVELFINWLYNQYGIIRKGVEDEKVDAVQKMGT
jgi:hypothetical protein